MQFRVDVEVGVEVMEPVAVVFREVGVFRRMVVDGVKRLRIPSGLDEVVGEASGERVKDAATLAVLVGEREWKAEVLVWAIGWSLRI